MKIYVNISHEILLIMGLLFLLVEGLVSPGISPAYIAGGDDTDGHNALSGHVALKYRLRHDSNDSSTFHSLYQSMDLIFEPKSLSSLDFAFSGDVYENIGGRVDDGSIWNAYGEVHGFIYDQYEHRLVITADWQF
ncbi:MAG: hypothetical protein KKD44_03325 [Proteobacteria bacterium]|nr:hypothetical protein [Pseudomonadota bacterium]